VSLLNRLGLNRHLTDTDLMALWADVRVGESPQSDSGVHVRECAACRARLASISSWLDSLRTDAGQEADEAFPRERLAVQQSQILRRLEAMEKPARVLAFPRFAKAISARDDGRQRWIAAAAAAGLIVGIGLGQTLHLVDWSIPAGTQARAVTSPEERAARGGVVLTPIAGRSDEMLLYDPEPSLSSERIPESLRSLHEITPSVRDYSAR
jgi:hypothetical protein